MNAKLKIFDTKKKKKVNGKKGGKNRRAGKEKLMHEHSTYVCMYYKVNYR